MTALLLTLFISVQAQKPSQTVRGYVFDQVSKQPVEGAEIYLQDTEPLIGTATLADGSFMIENVPVGRHVLIIKHIGFQPGLEDVVVEGGKPLYIEVSLYPSYNELETVTISSKPFISDINAVGRRNISIEQSTRFAANYLDPARVMLTFPGVVPQNDQNNNIIINGKSPNGLLWRIEGMDVLNPSHLSNAGTLSDRPTSNGGGVNVLSAQMLGKTGFVTAPFGAQYGNVLSGVMEMNFWPGSKKKNLYTAQASLLGLDVAAEGPLKQDKSSFLVNYRYSTVGLLSKAGVDFGGEEIDFQDVSFHLSFDHTKGGRLSVFGYGGNSNNVFDGVEDPDEWEFDKDSTSVDFSSSTGAFGIKEVMPVGNRSSLSLGTVLSGFTSKRLSSGLTREGVKNPAENYELKSYMLASNAEFVTSAGASQIAIGISANFKRDDLIAEEFYTGRGTLIDGNGEGLLLQPYISINTYWNDRWSTQAGLRYMDYTYNNTTALLPAMLVNYNVSNASSFNVNYSRQSQLQTPEIYFSVDNAILEMSKSHHAGFGYKQIFKNALFTSELFYEQLYDIPVSATRSSSLSVINNLNDYVLESLANNGVGEVYGVNLAYERPMYNNLYYIISGAFFESVYEGSDNIERDTRFNNTYTFSLTAGKELVKEKKADAVNITGFNGRLFYAGGLRTTPVSESLSQLNQQTVYEEDKAFSEQLDDYIRFDFRISFKKEKAGYSRMFAIDIQNLLSIENDGYEYFDFRQGKTVVKKQLGIIPILVYRVEF